MVDIDAAAKAAGVSRKAILKRIRANKTRGLSGDDLLSTRKGGHYKITEAQAEKFWMLVIAGHTTDHACEQARITISQGDNIRSGKAWNHITGKKKVIYD